MEAAFHYSASVHLVSLVLLLCSDPILPEFYIIINILLCSYIRITQSKVLVRTLVSVR